MAIRVIEKAEVKCDKCGKLLANMTLSKELLNCLVEEQRFTTVACLDCEKSLSK